MQMQGVYPSPSKPLEQAHRHHQFWDIPGLKNIWKQEAKGAKLSMNMFDERDLFDNCC